MFVGAYGKFVARKFRNEMQLRSSSFSNGSDTNWFRCSFGNAIHLSEGRGSFSTAHLCGCWPGGNDFYLADNRKISL